MKLDIKNRFTGKSLFTAEIECSEDAPHSLKIGLAVELALKNDADLRDTDLRDTDLRGANLRDANLRDADLRYANLCGADLSGAYLRDANLSGASLCRTDLRDANLSGADLSGAYLRDASIISCGNRSDGYEFFAQVKDGEIWIKAGCRYFNATDARKHWNDTRGGTTLGDESQAMIDHAVRLVAIRGLLEAEGQ